MDIVIIEKSIMLQAISIILFAFELFDCTLNFEKEKIVINISGGECILKGDYYFRNDSPESCERLIFYPLINTRDLPFPYFICVTDLYEKEAINYKISEDGITFTLKVSPYDTKVIRIEYHQKIRSNRFEYILTTTSYWKKPLKRADFLISLPKQLTLSSISIPYDSTQMSSDVQKYYIQENNFMPKANLLLEWRVMK